MPREVAVVSTLPRRVAEPALEERRTGIVVTALEQRVRDRMSDVAASRLEGIRALRQTERLRAVVQLAVCKRVLVSCSHAPSRPGDRPPRPAGSIEPTTHASSGISRPGLKILLSIWCRSPPST